MKDHVFCRFVQLVFLVNFIISQKSFILHLSRTWTNSPPQSSSIVIYDYENSLFRNDLYPIKFTMILLGFFNRHVYRRVR